MEAEQSVTGSLAAKVKLQEICHQKNKLGTTDYLLFDYRFRIGDCGFKISETIVRSQSSGFQG